MVRSRWLSHKENPILGINLTGFEADRQGVETEIAAVEEMMRGKPTNSLLVVLDLAFTNMTPEIISFLHAHSGQPDDPIRRMAIVGIPGWRQTWYRLKKKMIFPKYARFFDEHEKAKAWLIGEIFSSTRLRCNFSRT